MKLDTKKYPFYTIVNVLEQIASLSLSNASYIRRVAVDKKIFAGLVMSLTLHHLHDEIAFFTGIINSDSVWMKNWIQAKQKKADSSLSNFRNELFSKLTQQPNVSCGDFSLFCARKITFFFFYAGLLANQDPHFIVVAIVLWVNWQPLFFIHSIPNRRIGETFWVSKATKVFYSTCGHHSTFNYDLHHIHVLRLMKFFLCFMLLCKDLTRLVSTDILLNCFKLIRAEKEGAEMLELICIHFFTEQLYAIVEFVETVLKISVSIRKKKGVCFTNNPNLFQFFSFYSLV